MNNIALKCVGPGTLEVFPMNTVNSSYPRLHLLVFNQAQSENYFCIPNLGFPAANPNCSFQSMWDLQMRKADCRVKVCADFPGSGGGALSSVLFKSQLYHSRKSGTGFDLLLSQVDKKLKVVLSLSLRGDA